ncbi:hypothetical protein PGQ11_005428 [Apiospora arundinis]|uniref:Uncharacterized protein n=1 Tax=Apiospora arundinis TaxID=335852 RepID=A0ABR2JAV7_9PEZI
MPSLKEPKKKVTFAPDCPDRPEPGKDDGNEVVDEGEQQSKLYRMVMTPVNLISFILGLWLVDLKYRCQRGHNHSRTSSSSASSSAWYSPAWLWKPRREQPYDWVGGAGPTPVRKQNEDRFYYHTKQKKLMRMEAAEALQLRNRVIVGMVLVAMFVLLATSWVTRSLVAWLVEA